ncbi:hypothetical protein PAXRUDRAFT_565265 [Paxillus rubicundulus Ve08.2h10]|uniref:Uncharacterized protein n=1 Tax=Paxillus rubicundulus Ve08.2h10 TaxID=930991 RepID=A0A0D0ECE6_9AGAM|nr:hypothetical protein PAXRUDRAFT_565265 [Paxillus rubicundulus Ve08.2h10]
MVRLLLSCFHLQEDQAPVRASAGYFVPWGSGSRPHWRSSALPTKARKVSNMFLLSTTCSLWSPLVAKVFKSLLSLSGYPITTDHAIDKAGI